MTLTPYAAGLSSGPLPVVILGNDAVLAALPAHPVQLAHACHAVGFHSVVPASWGDELVAAATVREAALRTRAPVVTCACPLVRTRLCGATNELDCFLFGVVAPPIAAARYVRRLFAPAAVHLTYVGACEAGGDAVFDTWISPMDLFSRFQSDGITAEAQPLTFDGVVPPDRRRHYSIPGGAPSPEALAERDAVHELAVLCDGDVLLPLAELLLARQACVVDAAPSLGCVCAGGLPSGSGRAAIVSLEPPRAPTPVLDARILVDTTAPLSAPRTRGNGAVATSPGAVRDDPGVAPLDAPHIGLAITPPHVLEAIRAAAGPGGPKEFWRRPPGLQPPEEPAPELLPSSEAVTAGLQQTAVMDAGPTATAAVSDAPVDRGAAESALRRSPSHIRRVPPPRPGRGWSVAGALLLVSAAVAAFWWWLR